MQRKLVDNSREVRELLSPCGVFQGTLTLSTPAARDRRVFKLQILEQKEKCTAYGLDPPKPDFSEILRNY